MVRLAVPGSAVAMIPSASHEITVVLTATHPAFAVPIAPDASVPTAASTVADALDSNRVLKQADNSIG